MKKKQITCPHCNNELWVELMSDGCIHDMDIPIHDINELNEILKSKGYEFGVIPKKKEGERNRED